jgi:hypothetical protein
MPKRKKISGLLRRWAEPIQFFEKIELGKSKKWERMPVFSPKIQGFRFGAS